MKYLSLFAGAGGGDLAAQLIHGWTAVGYVEYDPKPAAMLQARVDDGHLSAAPVFVGKVSEFNRTHAALGMADVVVGGFPCQPFSNAGKQGAADDPRNAWPETAECIRIVQPAYALLENVQGLVTLPYFATILADLAALGYDANWRIVSAADAGAAHVRNRVWIVAFRTARPLPAHISPPIARLVDGQWYEAQGGLFGSQGPYLGRMPRAGMLRGTAVYARNDWKAVRGTKMQWPTPTVHDEKAFHPAELNRNSPPLMAMVQLWPTATAGNSYRQTKPAPSEGNGHGRTLGGEVMRHKSWKHGLGDMAKIWPTATVNGNYNRHGLGAKSGDGLATAVGLWRSPSAAVIDRKRRMVKLFGRRETDPQVGLADQVAAFSPRNWEVKGSAATTAAKSLHPEWVECLMGWPMGWTQLEPLPTLEWPAAEGLHPAPPGPTQHAWEPPRISPKHPQKRARLKALGNGQVPGTAALAWQLLVDAI